VITQPRVESTVLRCANPSCHRVLSSPGDAKTYEFEIVSVAVAASDEESHQHWDESPKREAKRIYLCSKCARIVSIRVGPEGIIVSPAAQAE
jgi:hypothetical protein